MILIKKSEKSYIPFRPRQVRLDMPNMVEKSQMMNSEV